MNNSIFNNENKYGYKLNVNHEQLNKLYRRYKDYKGLSPTLPLTDEQRLEFEQYIMNTKAFKQIAKAAV